MPMDESWHVELIVDANLELLSHFCGNARCAIRLANAEHRGGLSVHFDSAPLDAEDRNRPRLFPSARSGRLRPRAMGCGYTGGESGEHGGSARQHHGHLLRRWLHKHGRHYGGLV